MVLFNAVRQRQWRTRSVCSVAKLLPPMTDQGNLEKLPVYSGVANNIKTISYRKKTSCGKAALKTRKNKYLGMIMTHIKNFWKYKKILIS